MFLHWKTLPARDPRGTFLTISVTNRMMPPTHNRSKILEVWALGPITVIIGRRIDVRGLRRRTKLALYSATMVAIATTAIVGERL